MRELTQDEITALVKVMLSGDRNQAFLELTPEAQAIGAALVLEVWHERGVERLASDLYLHVTTLFPSLSEAQITALLRRLYRSRLVRRPYLGRLYTIRVPERFHLLREQMLGRRHDIEITNPSHRPEPTASTPEYHEFRYTWADALFDAFRRYFGF